MADLTRMNCVPARKGEMPFNDEEISRWKAQVQGWEVIEEGENKRLQRVFKFKNFVEALDFTNRVGEIAEIEDHHPSLLTEWGKVTVTWWTHTVSGLHKNDFIMAAKTDNL